MAAAEDSKNVEIIQHLYNTFKDTTNINIKILSTKNRNSTVIQLYTTIDIDNLHVVRSKIFLMSTNKIMMVTLH